MDVARTLRPARALPPRRLLRIAAKTARALRVRAALISEPSFNPGIRVWPWKRVSGASIKNVIVINDGIYGVEIC
jgi:hypothetical protein